MDKLNGKTISHLLKTNNITIRDAAEKMGIHYNNLSNIINGGQNYSSTTEQKVIHYFETALKVSSDLLCRNTYSEQLIRIKLSKQPAKNEIPIIREDLITIEKTILFLNWMDKKFYENDDYITQRLWDIYTIPYKDIDLYDWSLRRTEFFNLKQQFNIESFRDALNFLYSKDVQDLLFDDGFLYIGKDTGTSVINIAEKLGIKIIFIPLSSSKLISASTPFFDKNGILQEPIIFINKNACISPEEILWNISKELFYILFKDSEYISISDYKFEIENKKCGGYQFAETILFNEETFKNFLKTNKRVLTRYFPSSSKGTYYDFSRYSENGWIYLICEIKRYFRVSYKLIISKLYELNFENVKEKISEADFCEYFINAVKNYNQSFSEPAYKIIDGEPCVKTFDYSIDNLKICITCLENNKNMDEEVQSKYKEFAPLIKQIQHIRRL